MTEPNLLVICVTAFVAVVLLLSVLAGVIRTLMAVFPERVAEAAVARGTDSALLAAIHSATAVAYPGMKVTRIEELR